VGQFAERDRLQITVGQVPPEATAPRRRTCHVHHIQFAAFRSPSRARRIDRASIANHVRPLRVPADGIAASENGQRAEALEPRDCSPQPCVVAVMRPRKRRAELPVRSDQAACESLQSRRRRSNVSSFRRSA
jgi:hypothetical protein